MKKDIYLFYRVEYDPLTFFKIKNADLRNPSVFVEHRGYKGETAWKTFVSSFIVGNSKCILDNNVVIGRDFEGFILTYYDTVLEKEFLFIDPETIIEKLSE